jgi:hypothetical protein
MNVLAMLDAALEGPALEESQRAFYGTGFVVFASILTVIGVVTFLGILFMTLVVAPNVTQRFSTALRERNVRSFFVGLPVSGGFTVLGLALHNVPVLAAITTLLYGILLVLGLASASEDIGRRLYWACGKEGSRAAHLAGGWLVFAFASCVPVLGWFVILPYVALSGLGSVVVGTFSRKASPAAADVEFAKE